MGVRNETGKIEREMVCPLGGETRKNLPLHERGDKAGKGNHQPKKQRGDQAIGEALVHQT